MGVSGEEMVDAVLAETRALLVGRLDAWDGVADVSTLFREVHERDALAMRLARFDRRTGEDLTVECIAYLVLLRIAQRETA